jgi:acyl-CoA thioesterase-1
MKVLFYLFILCMFACEKAPLSENISPKDVAQTEDTSKRIIFFGDSLTAGYGLDDHEKSWPHLVVSRLASEGYHFKMTNAGVSGDTSSGGLGRIDWVLSQKPNIFILELGANDMLRGISPSVTRKNLKAMIEKVQREYPDCEILILGMKATPNLGKPFRDEFDAIYSNLARDSGITLLPFLLEKVAGIRNLNQKDGIHPTEEGHGLVADTVYPYLKKLAVRSYKR